MFGEKYFKHELVFCQEVQGIVPLLKNNFFRCKKTKEAEETLMEGDLKIKIR